MYDIRSEDNGYHPWEGSDKEGRSRLLAMSFFFPSFSFFFLALVVLTQVFVHFMKIHGVKFRVS